MITFAGCPNYHCLGLGFQIWNSVIRITLGYLKDSNYAGAYSVDALVWVFFHV